MKTYRYADGEYEIKTEIKRSVFIASVKGEVDAQGAEDFVRAIRKKYPDATHNCYAYISDELGNVTRFSDDGEPSGTAGRPILGQINSFGLTNIVICVVRYFGGIKLGTSGLIVAYKEAAREAIEAGEIIECHEMAEVTFTFPYLAMNDVMKLVKNCDAQIVSQIFDNSCSMTLSTRLDNEQMLKNRLEDIDGVTLS